MGIPLAAPKAIIPPVDVPHIKSNCSLNSVLNSFSRHAKSLAEYRPFIPPPSMQRILKGLLFFSIDI